MIEFWYHYIKYVSRISDIEAPEVSVISSHGFDFNSREHWEVDAATHISKSLLFIVGSQLTSKDSP